jgi:hypothetical protein
VSDQGLSVPPQPMPGHPPQGGYPQGPGGPPDPQDPLPQKRSHWGRNAVLGVLGALVIIVVILVATSGGGGSPTPSGGGSQGRVRPSALHSPATGVGASFAVGDGRGHTYQMRLDLIMDPVQGAARPTAPRHGMRLVGVVLTVKAISGSPRNLRAARDAVLVGSDGKTYRPATGSIPGYAGFRHGLIKVAPGASMTGALAFQMPAGVSVSRVRWSAAPGSALQWPVLRSPGQ